MKRTLFLISALLMALSVMAQEYNARYQSVTEPQSLLPEGYVRLQRREIILPSVKGYTPYKADLHNHTVYADHSQR